jgi:Tol biopolymer transport system component
LSPVAWAPDGRRFAYGARDGVWVHGVGDAGGARIAPGEAVTAVAWSAEADAIAYVDRGVLYTVRPDGRERRRVPLRGVASHPVWAPGGDRLAVAAHQPGVHPPADRLWITSPSGALMREVQWDPRTGSIVTLGWYPDALHLFVGLGSADGETIAEWWRVRIAYPDYRRLPSPPPRVVESSLSPRGDWVAYVADGSAGERASVMRLDGSSRREVSAAGHRVSGITWSPHGDKVAYGVLVGEAQADVHVAAVMGTARMLVATYKLEFPDPAAGLALAWSPDGTRLAYGTNTGSMAGPVWIARFAPR